MHCFQYILCVLSVLTTSHEVKVNLQGSLRIDKDFMESLAHYMKRKNNLSSLKNLSSRRALPVVQSDDQNNEPIAKVVESMSLCRDVEVCKGKVKELVNDYIIDLTMAIEEIFNVGDTSNIDNNTKPIIFELEEFKTLLSDIRTLLVTAEDKIDDPDYALMDLIKKISAKFNKRALTFLLQKLDGSPDEVKKVKKLLGQEVTIAMALVELKFERRLCADHHVCTKNYECTRALNTLLERIQILPEETTRKFVRYFYETLPDTGFYYTIGDVAIHELQTILNDMAYSESIPTQKVLSMVHKSVKERLDYGKQNIENDGGVDVKLVNIILSDMDHLYDKHREPFKDFLNAFYKWSNKGGRFSGPLRRIMYAIQKTLFESEELSQKLQNEVKVFLELTVNSDK